MKINHRERVGIRDIYVCIFYKIMDSKQRGKRQINMTSSRRRTRKKKVTEVLLRRATDSINR